MASTTTATTARIAFIDGALSRTRPGDTRARQPRARRQATVRMMRSVSRPGLKWLTRSATGGEEAPTGAPRSGLARRPARSRAPGPEAERGARGPRRGGAAARELREPG